MRRERTLTSAGVALCTLGAMAWAQTQTTVTKETTKGGVTVTRTIQKSTDVLGRPIMINTENVGKVEDLVVDVNTGRVVYGVGSFTTVTGAGGRLYVIPWPAVRYKTETRAYDLEFETAKLQGAPSFTVTEMPNFADEEFATRTYRYYNVTPYWQTERTTVVKTADRPATTIVERPTAVYRVTELRGREIRTPEGVLLGPINEVVLDPATGRILYAVVIREGRTVPIPWTALRAHDGKHFELTITAERWKTAPVIETERWTTITEPQFVTEVERYYKVKIDRDDGETKIKIEREDDDDDDDD